MGGGLLAPFLADGEDRPVLVDQRDLVGMAVDKFLQGVGDGGLTGWRFASPVRCCDFQTGFGA